MPGTKIWTDAHRKGLLSNFKNFISELDTLRDPRKIFDTATDGASKLCTLYKKLITSLKKEFHEDIKKSPHVWVGGEKRTSKDFYHYVLGCLLGCNFSYKEKSIDVLEKTDLEHAIGEYFYDGYAAESVKSYVKVVKELYEYLNKLAKGTEFYDKKEKILYLYLKELPLEVRNKLAEKHGEDWDIE